MVMMLASSSSAKTMTFTSGWSTPTIQEQGQEQEQDSEEEFLLSMQRIQRESRREQKEAIKFLCNDPSANRIIGRAVEERRASRAAVQNTKISSYNRSGNGGCSSSSGSTSGSSIAGASSFNGPSTCFSSPFFLDCSRRRMELKKRNELILGDQLETASIWEKAERKRRNEEVARRAMSLDSLINFQGEKNWNKIGNVDHEGIYDNDNEYDDDDDDEDWAIHMKSCVSLSKSSIFDRRCPNRPPSPQPIPPTTTIVPPTRPPRRASESVLVDLRRHQTNTNNNSSNNVYFSSPTYLSSSAPSTSRLGKMGANRLQRSFDSNQRKQTNPASSSTRINHRT